MAGGHRAAAPNRAPDASLATVVILGLQRELLVQKRASAENASQHNLERKTCKRANTRRS